MRMTVLGNSWDADIYDMFSCQRDDVLGTNENKHDHKVVGRALTNRMSLAEGEEGAFRGARLPASYGDD
jgi:hypothetical protein